MSEILKQTTSLLNSAIGPVAVKTTDYKKYDVDDYVQSTVRAQSQYLAIVKKAETINPLEVENRPPVVIGTINLGGYSG